MNNTEIWKDIKGYEGLYQVSNLGRVRSIKRNIIMKQKKNKRNGYLQITLHKNCLGKTFNSHKLVALAFIKNPKPEQYNQVNHINEIKTDNRIENIMWCDNKFNCNWGNKTETVKKAIEQFTRSGQFIKRWNSLTEVEEKLGYRKSNISACANGKLPHAYNFLWSFCDK